MMHTAANVLFKIPFLIGILWANRITYTSPTPVVTTRAPAIPSKAGYLTVNMRPPWVRKASKLIVRMVVTLEIFYLVTAALLPSYVAYTSSSTVLTSPVWRTCAGIQTTPLFTFGWALLIAGALIRKACYREMGKNFTFELTIRKEHNLVTTGPYSIVRHPGYTAICAVVSGTVVCLFGKGSLLAECGILGTWIGRIFAAAWLAELLSVPSIMIFSRVRTEDDMLRKTFGREWADWASRTPYVLFPWIY